MKEPELVTATQDELDELLRLAKTNFPTKQYELLEGVLATFVYVMLKLLQRQDLDQAFPAHAVWPFDRTQAQRARACRRQR